MVVVLWKERKLGRQGRREEEGQCGRLREHCLLLPLLPAEYEFSSMSILVGLVQVFKSGEMKGEKQGAWACNAGAQRCRMQRTKLEWLDLSRGQKDSKEESCNHLFKGISCPRADRRVEWLAGALKTPVNISLIQRLHFLTDRMHFYSKQFSNLLLQ